MSAVQNVAATPPGGIHKDYTFTTTNAYQTVCDIADENGMIAEASIKNLDASNVVSYKLTTNNMQGTATNGSATDATNAATTDIAPATQFVTRFKLEVKSKVADSAATLVIKLNVVNLGRQVTYAGL